MNKVILELPAEFARSFGTNDEGVVRNAKLALAIEMHREGKWSIGKAADFVGLYVGSFMDVLRDRGVSRSYTARMLAHDIAYAHARF